MEGDPDNYLAEREQDQDISADSGDVLRPGQRIGAYRIIRRLGAGGMGKVYEAEHVALRTRRALKVFSTESEHKEFLRKRFVKEGCMLADLEHPRIVRVYDLVVDEDSGTAYFGMDLVLSPNGQPRTLADEQREGVSEDKIVGWFKDICEGLAYIHSQGVIHRDISLDNILIGPDGRAVITDFGIAKIIDDSFRKRIDMTVTVVSKDGSELRMGKGLYMAPEVKNGGKVTYASDAYAVGVILFRLLMGSWYDVGAQLHLDDYLADFEYEWSPIFSRLCNIDPEKRLGEGGIVALPALLERKVLHVPFWRRKWVILNGIAAMLFAITFIGYCVTEYSEVEQFVDWLEEYKIQTDHSTGMKTVTICKVINAPSDFTMPTKIYGYSVKNIEPEAFSDCEGLNSVTMPNGVTSIEDGTFSQCSELMCVKIPASVTSIGERAFKDCRKLSVFIVESNNTNYKSCSGLLMTKDGKTLIHGVNGDVTIPDGVTRIANEAFWGCSGLSRIRIPPGVTNIGARAFGYCDGLRSVIIPVGVTSIGDWAFGYCDGLMNVTIPSGVTSIGESTFSGCTWLTSVTLPASLIHIGRQAFALRALKSVYVSTGDTERVKKLFVDSVHDIKDIEFVEPEDDGS